MPDARNPTVSIVLPTYNRARLLDRAIESVVDQTYEDFELIVVDDGSTDNTEKVVAGVEDNRIIYVSHDTNRGAAAARNTGIKKAKGEYIAFQDSDDIWHEKKLEKQVEWLDKLSLSYGVVYTGFWQIEDNTREYRAYIPGSDVSKREGNLSSELLKHNFITTQASLVRQECIQQVGGFDERLPRLQDWELWLRMSNRYKFKLIDLPLVTAYIQQDSITADQDALVDAMKIILTKHRRSFRNSRPVLVKHWLILAYRNHKQRKIQQTIVCSVHAIIVFFTHLIHVLLRLLTYNPTKGDSRE